MRNRYNSNYERFKVEANEEEFYGWEKSSYNHDEKHEDERKQADKDFYKIGGAVALIMATFLLFILVILFIVFVQIILMYYGGNMFRTVPLTLKEFITMLILSFTVIPVDILRKLMCKNKIKSMAV